MNEKPLKANIGFQEALRRIANTPKNLIAADKKQQEETKNNHEKRKKSNKTVG